MFISSNAPRRRASTLSALFHTSLVELASKTRPGLNPFSFHGDRHAAAAIAAPLGACVRLASGAGEAVACVQLLSVRVLGWLTVRRVACVVCACVVRAMHACIALHCIALQCSCVCDAWRMLVRVSRAPSGRGTASGPQAHSLACEEAKGGSLGLCVALHRESMSEAS